MGDPPFNGAVHVITIFSPTSVVKGLFGLFGSYAARIDTDWDFIL